MKNNRRITGRNKNVSFNEFENAYLFFWNILVVFKRLIIRKYTGIFLAYSFLSRQNTKMTRHFDQPKCNRMELEHKSLLYGRKQKLILKFRSTLAQV
jgi:hypothetical protein